MEPQNSWFWMALALFLDAVLWQLWDGIIWKTSWPATNYKMQQQTRSKQFLKKLKTLVYSAYLLHHVVVQPSVFINMKTNLKHLWTRSSHLNQNQQNQNNQNNQFISSSSTQHLLDVQTFSEGPPRWRRGRWRPRWTPSPRWRRPTCSLDLAVLMARCCWKKNRLIDDESDVNFMLNLDKLVFIIRSHTFFGCERMLDVSFCLDGQIETEHLKSHFIDLKDFEGP